MRTYNVLVNSLKGSSCDIVQTLIILQNAFTN